MSDKRNVVDCGKCHNKNCTLSGKEMHMAACTGYKSWTNYDKIHSMNVESLAEWIEENSCNAMWCDPSAPVEPDTGMCALYDCKACIVKWLESEVKNGTSDKMGRKN